MVHLVANHAQFLLIQADFFADGSRAVWHIETLLSQYNGQFFGGLGSLHRENFEDNGIGDSLLLTFQRTFLRQNAGIEMRNFQKICAPAFAKAGARCICGYEI